MAGTTSIEWTQGPDGAKGSTWNPVTGCTKVSPGCDNCYAETFAERWRGIPGHPYEQGFDLKLWPERLDLPQRWRKPRLVFANSMSDLFHARVPYEFVERVWETMAATPQHTYQILTKRPDRMQRFAARLVERFGILPNVWLGTSIESQEYVGRADHLARTLAAVRFISAEPLLGPLDLSQWLRPVAPVEPDKAPRTWVEWAWPDWVVPSIRTAIEGFWSEEWGRGPRAWLRDMEEQGAHAFGARISSPDGFRTSAPLTTGRFVHAWGNIGRLVRDDGTFAYTSFVPREVWSQKPVHWVIAGGESGPGARPCSLDWIRDIRDQCKAASVACFVKQVGRQLARELASKSAKGGELADWPADLRIREMPHGQ